MYLKIWRISTGGNSVSKQLASFTSVPQREEIVCPDVAADIGKRICLGNLLQAVKLVP